MNLAYQQLLDPDFDPSSRVWVYQSSRLFELQEALQVEKMLNDFTGGWLSHGTPVKGEAHLFFGQFIVFLADETASGVSGCSTDSSVHLVKEIEQLFKVNMFDRTSLAFLIKNPTGAQRVQLLPMAQLQYAVDNGFITAESPYFNNLVQTKEELEKKWIIPASESWWAKKVSFLSPVQKDRE